MASAWYGVQANSKYMIAVLRKEHRPDRLKNELKEKMGRERAAWKRLRLAGWEDQQQQEDMQEERTREEYENAALLWAGCLDEKNG